MRRTLALALLCGTLAFAQPASAQGLWIGGPGFGGFGFGGLGFGSLGFGGYSGLGYSGLGYGGYGFSPYGFGNAAYFAGGYPTATFAYPLAVRPVYVPRTVYVARPIAYGGIAPAPVFVPRPAVRVPLNRAYRRAWRRGW